MYSVSALYKQFLEWWYLLCTGHVEESELDDEEHYRRRILVMASLFWLVTVMALTVVTPALIDLTPEGSLAADVLFVITALGVLISMALLRIKGHRIMALSVLLSIYTGAFAASCLIFGGTQSPTYPLLIMAPAMAGVAGSVFISALWGGVVVAIWVAILAMEMAGYPFVQIIVPANHSTAMLLAIAGMGVAMVAVINIYAEMNKALRNSLQESNAELAHLSTHDQLTRLPNRRFYDKRMTQALQRAAERNGMTGLLFIDLNDFKLINDNYGHGAGDKLLVTVAERIQESLRETDLVARLGGDEFAAVLEDVKSPEQITRIAHKLSQAIEQPLFVRNEELVFSASIGVAIFPIDGRQQQELEEQADKAMYLAKKRRIPVALSSLEASNTPVPVKPNLKQV